MHDSNRHREEVKAEHKAKAATAKLLKLHRRHKTAIHAVTLGFIALSLFTEGFKMADVGFLALSILCELN